MVSNLTMGDKMKQQKILNPKECKKKKKQQREQATDGINRKQTEN